MQKKVYHTLEPFYDENSEILILGSLPSVKSREENFYYAHPKNRFWKVLSDVYEKEIPKTIEEKKNFLKENKIALYDVIRSCEIIGSSDSSIKNVKINNLKQIIKNSRIKRIYTTGKKSKELYDKYIKEKIKIEGINLPSTSPANATMSYEKLRQEYKRIIEDSKEE